MVVATAVRSVQGPEDRQANEASDTLSVRDYTRNDGHLGIEPDES